MIVLEDSLLIGCGAHKKCYRHPKDESKVIKILHQIPDDDWDKEYSYRKSLDRRGITLSVIPKYFGMIQTSLGSGYVFERILDFDGSNSITMDEYIMKFGQKDINKVVAALKKLKKSFFDSNVIVSNMHPCNFLLQFTSPNEYIIKIIDNIGTPVLIPIIYYVDFIAKKRNKKYWGYFMNDLKMIYPDIFTEDVLKHVR